MPLLCAHFFLFILFLLHEACRCFNIRNEFVKKDLLFFASSFDLFLIDNIFWNKFYLDNSDKWTNLLSIFHARITSKK